jgi:hypothetical protein
MIPDISEGTPYLIAEKYPHTSYIRFCIQQVVHTTGSIKHIKDNSLTVR